MKFLADQDVYVTTIRFLEELGHDVVPAAQIGMSQANDADLLRAAQAQGRIFITRDRDYGGLVFVVGIRSGVVYLRIVPSTLAPVHLELARVLDMYTEQELRNAFVVVEAGRHRFRMLGP
jgi:predicted nuclease of predicted toxin-antitoxin system